MESSFKNKWSRKAPARPLNLLAQFRKKIQEAGIDNLTGILRRELLDSRLNELINELKMGNKRSGAPDRAGFMVIFLDLDGLKSINDKHGHTTGDVALVLFGERLSGIVKRKDIDRIYRYGGDEFVMVLPIDGVESDTDENARLTFQRIKNEVNQDLFIPEGDKIEASMGYSVYKKSDIDKSPDEIIKEADDKMYENKKARKAGRTT